MSVFRRLIIMAAVAAGVGANLVPASRTPVPRQQATAVEKGPPVTAAATAFPRFLGRRARNICGYIDGAYSAWCVDPFSCFYNDTASAAGCCMASDSCDIPTACQPSTSPRPSNTDLTKHCSYSASPSCLSLIYSDGPCLGCTWFVCDTAGGRMAILTTKSRGVSTRPPTTPPPRPTPSPEPSPRPSPTPVPPPQVPTGAIVGGVVGGVAALALTGHLLFFLLRRRKSKGSGSQTPETQGGSGTPEDDSSSRARSVAANTSTVPSSPSPPSHYQHSIAGTNWSASPAAIYPSGHVDQQLVPRQHFQARQSWYPSPPQEMAITPPGRPVQEMQEVPEMPGNS